AKISSRYLLIELLTGALFLACYWYFGLTFSMLKYCTFAFLLLGLIFSDAETKLLPNKLTLPGIALGVLFSLIVPVNDLASQFVSSMVNLPVSDDIATRLFSLFDSLLGAADNENSRVAMSSLTGRFTMLDTNTSPRGCFRCSTLFLVRRWALRS